MPNENKKEIARLLTHHHIPLIDDDLFGNLFFSGTRPKPFKVYLRTLRHTLHTNCLRFQQAIEDYFPENTKISQPQGGFFLWLELDGRLDTAELYQTALKQKLSFAPGSMFSQNSNFNNCMRLNFALPWDDSIENDIKRLGNIVKQAL